MIFFFGCVILNFVTNCHNLLSEVFKTVLIVCVDDSNGMMFNSRRQSRDKAVCERIINITRGKRLFMDSYSMPLFADRGNQIICAENFAELAEKDDFCFAEDIDPAAFESKIQKIILYKWNRRYPSDLKFTIELSDWLLTETTDFQGSSHERITEEVYVRQ